ncbi:hypothetical protein [Streptomyces sp. NPDC047718]|uniref:hypothetical protein n=1 Tax=Streptomyces sp. NPDC047718 TaxID=3155479 RepID=UPI0033E7F392
MAVEGYVDDGSGRTLRVREDLAEDHVFGGQQAPRCVLWKHGERNYLELQSW